MKNFILILTAVMLFCAVFSACGAAAAPGETTEETSAEVTTATSTTGSTTVETTEETTADETTSESVSENATAETELMTLNDVWEGQENATVRVFTQTFSGYDDKNYVNQIFVEYHIYERDADEVIEQLKKYLTEPELTYCEDGQWYRAQSNIRIVLDLEDGKEFQYFFAIDHMYPGESPYIDIGDRCYVGLNGERCVYGLSDEGEAYIENLLDEIVIKYAEN